MVLSWLTTNFAADLDNPEIAALHEAVTRRMMSLGSVEFEYEVIAPPITALHWDIRSEDALEDGRIRSRDRFAIRVPDGAPSNVVWRAWRRTVSNREGTPRLDRLVLWDGKTSRTLVRSFGKEGSIPKAKIVAWEEFDQYIDNKFDSILFLTLFGLAPHFDPEGKAAQKMDRGFHVTRREMENGVQVTTLEGAWRESKLRYRIEVLGEPHYLVRRCVAHSEETNQDVLVDQVDEIKQFEGVSYPARGSRRQEAVGLIPAIHYEFRVTNVRRLAPDDIGPWKLDTWPPGTRLVDHVQNRGTTVPQDLKEVSKYITENRRRELGLPEKTIDDSEVPRW